MAGSRVVWPGLLAFAGAGLWLLLAGPADVLGIDSGNAGMVLLMTATWTALYQVGRLPPEDVVRVGSPAEWKAWIGTAFMAAAIAYFLTRGEVLAGVTVFNDPHAQRIGRNLVLLLVAWSVLSSVMASRWKGVVEQDERDREIAAQASGWGRGALVAVVIGLAVLLGLSPASRLAWASHLMIANLLIFALMWSCFVEYAATAAYYWRERRWQ
ncbi:hypothetical protein [Montanilutibacter psychrotolerans]|uniref:hypothetical protein n=1 Tax=Montanilutibacter psychrotolerans TaxID=1327343 RepID=UPI0011CD6678|nr:hypothetical protein [Lysobacter psychrotolerans]